jgi:tetratricopeptide (TPR) repeat protein
MLERQNEPGARRPITLSPWLVALLGIVLYVFTLNHWVTLSSLPYASQLTGWDWHPRTLLWRPTMQMPLFFALTAPLRLLPAGWRPLGLNIFSAICGALTLAILARTVRLFPHDRTKEQRQREGADYALLSMRAAFLPVAFAVLMLGLQLFFWENATSGTSEMLNLLVFAFLILCLFEYRLSLNERWLNVLALVYGIGMSNNWGLISFLPCFLAAVVWLRGMSFFQWRFLLRITGYGAIGLTFYLLLPIVGAAAHDAGFWDILHAELGNQSYVLKIYPRAVALVAWSLILVPVVFAAIKWPSFEAEMSPIAHDLTRGMFRVIHLVLLAFVGLMFFDLKFSPSPQRMGLPGFLTFFYLAALCIGYYSGYILLVFGRDVVYRWGQAKGLLRVVNKLVAGLLWMVAVALPTWLVCQNFPHIAALNGDTLARYGEALVKSLPPMSTTRQTIVLADDPVRLHIAQATAQRLGKSEQYIFLDSQSLNHRQYYSYLEGRYPQLQKLLKKPATLPPILDSLEIIKLVMDLAQYQQVYYLHPSEGYFFEGVNMVPRGLGGDLKLNAHQREKLLMPVMTPEEIAKNEAFWSDVKKGSLAALKEASTNELNPDAERVAIYYSQALNYWGVELQKAATQGQTNKTWLAEAGDQFEEATQLHPDNYLARINLRYNAILRGIPPPGGPLVSWQALANRVGDWIALLNIDGPTDTPELDQLIGRKMAVAGNYLQALHLFSRSLQLSPGNPLAELDIAKTYLDMQLYDDALSLIKHIREQGGPLPEDLPRVESITYTRKQDFATAEKLLVEAQQKNPKNPNYLGVLVDFYRIAGNAELGKKSNDPNKEQNAARWFNAGLAAADRQLTLLSGSMANTTDYPETLLRKAELQMLVKKYNDAIVTLTKALELDPENQLALGDRAISELEAGKVVEAKADYLTLDKMKTRYYFVYYGLTQIAEKQKDDDAEKRYAKLYLKYAPRQTTEYTNVNLQLQKLGGH